MAKTTKKDEELRARLIQQNTNWTKTVEAPSLLENRGHV